MEKILKNIQMIMLAGTLILQTNIYSLAQQNTQSPETSIEDEQSEPETENKVDETQSSDTNSNVTSEQKQKSQQEIEIPKVSYDLEALPFPTRRMHQLILAATKSGDIEKLRAYIGTGDSMTMLSLGEIEGDPIEFLKQETGDEKGHEILAILEEILQAGYVHLDKGSDRELFVWPYFFAYPLDKLTDPQMVELFSIVTYGDYQDMKDFGGYIFYRAGITPTGRWTFFVAGD